MTQGFPAQQNFGAPQFTQPQQQYAPPGPVPQYQQGAGNPAGGFWTQQDPHLQAQSAPQFQQQPPAPAPQTDTADFWGGAATISFDDRKGYVRGTPRGGQVISKQITNQTKMGTGEVLTWGDGSPRKQMVVTLQTSERADPQDNGQRQLFVKGDLPRAVREAIQGVGVKDIEVGGWLYAAWVDEKPAKQPGYNPQKIFKAVYAPPGAPDPMAGRPAYQAAPQQQAPGPISNMPAQHGAAINGMYQQAMQMDPALAAQAQGQPAPQTLGQFVAQDAHPTIANMHTGQPGPNVAPPGVPADQAAQFAAWQAQQQAAQPQPSGQPMPPGAPQQAAPPSPQQQGAQQQWSPFS